MVVAASVLAGLEAKINNVVERSHAWDTFQLHVASWNEQMHTINNKMDILSRSVYCLMQILTHFNGHWRGT